MAKKLTLAALADLPPRVGRPGYDRRSLTPGFLHIGVGNFHRAHMGVYLDRLFARGRDLDWAIVGAGIKSFDQVKRDALKGQDWLTTVVELAPEGLSAFVTASMMDFCDVDPGAILARLEDPAIRIVSMTLTEGGYFVDARTGGFNASHPEVAADVASPDTPQTVFGILAKALRARRDAGQVPFTVMSCDNLPENGHVARQAVVGFARLVDTDLARWIEANVAFPNGMVDCITPATSPAEIEMVAREFGIDDAAPVTCEPFRQWVLEDTFPAGRPALEEVGVEFVADVRPHETMKLRLLNAGHAAIAYPGALLGHHFVHEAMADPDITAWLSHLMRTDVIPILPPLEGADYHQYLAMCISRFSNPRIGDTIARLCLDGSNRQPKFVLPSISDALAAGRGIDALSLEVALWCRYCAATADPATGIALQDEHATALQEAALATRTHPRAFLGLTGIFGNLATDETFGRSFERQIGRLWDGEVRDVLRETVGA